MRPKYIYFLFACVWLIASCKGPQKTVYFENTAPVDPSVQVQRIDRVKELTVQPDDILAINTTSISSLIEKTPNIFNEGGTVFGVAPTMGGASGGSSSAGGAGFLVDPDGYIDFPIIGKLKVGGHTIRQVKEMIAQKMVAYEKDPVIEARIINFKVSVLGEVNHPGFVTSPSQRLTVLDALAAAGDIPISGRRDRVHIIRETEGNREFAYLNLNSRNVFSSPYFYLKQNDVVYVEPARYRSHENSEFFKFYLPAIATLISTVLAIYGITQIAK